MFTRKTRTLIVTAVAALSVAVAPASSQALTSKPTGDRALDAYCAEAGKLIDKALRAGDLALVNGQDDEASEWYQLAAAMIKRSQANGCDFGFRQVKRALRRAETGAIKAGSELTIGTNPEPPTAPTGPRVDNGSAPLGGLVAP